MNNIAQFHMDLDLLYERALEIHKTDDLIAMIKIYPRHRNLTNSVRIRIEKLKERASSLERRFKEKDPTYLEIEDSLTKLRADTDKLLKSCEESSLAFQTKMFSLGIEMPIIESKAKESLMQLKTVLIPEIVIDVSSKQVNDVLYHSCLLMELLNSDRVGLCKEFAFHLRESYHASYRALILSKVRKVLMVN